MEKITSCHLSFFVVKHVSLFVTKSIFAPFHGFLCSAPSFCPFRDLFVCFMLLPFSHCEGLATLLWQMWQQKNKNTVVYVRVMHVYARGRKEALRPKKEVASRARKLRRHGRLDAVLASERKQRRQGRKDVTQTKKRKCMGKCRGRCMGDSEFLCLYSGKKKQMRWTTSLFVNPSLHFNPN